MTDATDAGVTAPVTWTWETARVPRSAWVALASGLCVLLAWVGSLIVPSASLSELDPPAVILAALLLVGLFGSAASVVLAVGRSVTGRSLAGLACTAPAVVVLAAFAVSVVS